MVMYLIYGIIYSTIVDLIQRASGLIPTEDDMNEWLTAKLIMTLLWPCFLLITIYQFFKEMFRDIFVILIAIFFVSCDVELIPEDDPFVLGSPAVENSITQSGDLFTFYDLEDNSIQDVYLDTNQTVPYFKLFTEASAMKADYLYNGEHNVWGEYLSDQTYVETGSQFRLSTQATDYELPPNKIYGRNVIGIRDTQAIIDNQVITIYIEVYFDGYHREYDTVRIRLNAL